MWSGRTLTLRALQRSQPCWVLPWLRRDGIVPILGFRPLTLETMSLQAGYESVLSSCMRRVAVGEFHDQRRTRLCLAEQHFILAHPPSIVRLGRIHATRSKREGHETNKLRLLFDRQYTLYAIGIKGSYLGSFRPQRPSWKDGTCFGVRCGMGSDSAQTRT